MSFSNGGVDTFAPAKGFIGIRLQQGVPLLDRDWNELEDIRRHQEWLARTHHIGAGAFEGGSFRVEKDGSAVIVRAGRYSVGGFHVSCEQDVPLDLPAGNDVLV